MIMRKNLSLAGGTMLLAMTLFALGGCCNKQKKITMKPYPETHMDDVVDNYHGTEVTDAYRWLEDDTSAETAAWVKAQNEVTFDYLGQIPYREAVRARLTQLWDYPKEGAPSKHGDWYYFFRNDGLQNQSVMYRQAALDGEPELFMDPNKLSDDGTVALAAMSFSEDGRWFAYSVSVAGSDWVDIRVMDTETKEVMPDLIEWVKFSGASWDAESKGFYYSRYDEPKKGSELSGQNQFQKVYYHKLGDPQSADVLVYNDAAHPLRYFTGYESRDGGWLFVQGSEGTSGTEYLYKKKGTNAPFKVLLPGFASDWELVHCDANKAYFMTNNGAPNYRLVVVDLNEATPAVRDFLPENENAVLESANFVGGYLMVSYLENAQSAVYQYTKEGELIRKVELPGIGSAAGFGGKKDATETFYSLSTFTAPPTVYRYDLAEGTSTVFREPQVKYNPSLFTSQQIFFTSKDGTQVPMFVVHRKDIKLDGRNPLLLYGYGGFQINQTPGFNPNSVMFMEQGGVYVIVNLRGGGEFGEAWHQAGMLDRKQNVFDDFIGAAEYLIEKGYTSSDKIAIQGGSNGGLLVGACMTQRPDLFAVAIPQVGVLDMLRYHMFTVGWGWVVEYGSSENAEQFDYIYKYSPLHNLREGTCYPATMVTTADHDDRVVPAHSFKFAARLQAVQSCDKPALIRIDVNAGHGAGKPTSKRIEEAADIYSFIFWNTNTEVNFGK